MVTVIDYCSKGLPIELDDDTQEIIYKDNKVLFSHIKQCYESGRTKIQLTENLIYRKYDGLIEFGCLIITEEKVKQLIKKVWKQLN